MFNLKFMKLLFKRKEAVIIYDKSHYLASGEEAFCTFHLETLKTVISKKVGNLNDATMFSSNIQGDLLWKFENGILCHSGWRFAKKEWHETDYTTVEEARRNGVVRIYNLIELEEKYGEVLK